MIRRRTMELAAGVLIAGKYRLERPLASGGMGAVWVARHAQLDVPVALKFMDAEHANSATSRARFEREAKASAALRNQHVVHVLDYGVENGTPYLAMELLLGEDLRRRLHRERKLPLGVASRILTQAARGLRTAHEAGVVHRDLKPANIFLAKEGDDEEIVKLLDFGIAKETFNVPVGESTRTGELMGSPHYMSPEQVRAARDIDARSDLWSLSVILFRALTGQLPFTGDQLGAVIGAILADPVPVATRLAPDLPPGIDAFFERGFARNREQRFQSAREMAEAFAALVAGTGASAAAARWSLHDDPPTRPQLVSRYPLEVASDLQAPAPSSRMDLPSLQTELMAPDAQLAGITAAPLSAGLGGTGGPVIHSARPPAPRASARWLPVAGALAGVILGVTAFFALRTSRGAVSGAGAEMDAPSTTASAAMNPAATVTATPQPAPAPAPAPSAAASAAPLPSQTAAALPLAIPAGQAVAASPSSKATAHPSAAPTARPAASVKRPNWGF